MSQQELALGLIRVHCFCCAATVEETTPGRAHDAMEGHYRERHAELIWRLAREISGTE